MRPYDRTMTARLGFPRRLLLVGLVFVVRDTIRGKGRWGINTKPVACKKCGEPAPTMRAAISLTFSTKVTPRPTPASEPRKA